MFTRRPSDQGWIKHLLATGLVTVDQFERMRAGQNQVDIGELLGGNAQLFERDLWLNQALQQDRFHYIPVNSLDQRELAELRLLQPSLVSRCLSEGILPLGLSHQTLYLGLLRYDPDFPELKEVQERVPPELRVCLVPLAPADYSKLNRQLRGAATH